MSLICAAATVMIHIMQSCDNCPRDCTRSWICEANAHLNHLPRWFHWCELECTSTPCSQWECFAWISPSAYSWRNPGQMAWATVFSKLDAHCSFWQIPLHETSQKMTTYHSFWLFDERNFAWAQGCTVPHGWHFSSLDLIRVNTMLNWLTHSAPSKTLESPWTPTSACSCRRVFLPGSHHWPEWGSCWPWQNRSGLADEHPHQNHKTSSINRNGEQSWEIFTQPCRDIPAPSWSTDQTSLLAMGARSGDIAPSTSRGVGQTIVLYDTVACTKICVKISVDASA